jgi:hypothetical protein
MRFCPAITCELIQYMRRQATIQTHAPSAALCAPASAASSARRQLLRTRLSRQLRTPPTVAHPPQPPAPHTASCCAPASAASSARRLLLRTRLSRQLRTPPTVAPPPQRPAPHAANCCAPASAASLALRYLLRRCLSRQLNHSYT